MFDGWPAIVFSGWPNTSYGTYGGKVVAIDNLISRTASIMDVSRTGPR
ncbi:MAG: hypothetical protein R2818_02450 [Flavobacteriales bacterium]